MRRPHIERLHIGDMELPREFAQLYELAYNLWWSWSPRAKALFASIDNQSWSRYRNPVQMLINVEPHRWDALLDNEPFRSEYREVVQEFRTYMEDQENTWFHRHHPDEQGELIAYFSMEYGLHHSLALYSGGLGVLSGDHCKSASDLGLPFVAVGLLYRHGYFNQTIDATGLQQHSYPEYDFNRLPLRPASNHLGRELRVSVPLPGRDIQAKVWVAQVGRVPVLLLDTDVRENDPSDRPISDILYVRGREMRLVQEIVLGIGGVRALRALDLEPTVWHLNEGHCALLQLERLRERMHGRGHGPGSEGGESFEQALEEIRKDAVFTTHTPVPAGNEQFDAGLALRYLEPWGPVLGRTPEQLLALGAAYPDQQGQNLNLTAFSIRTTRHTNGVSQLNGEVADRMWRHLFPNLEEGERAVTGITNGIHSPTWIGHEVRELFQRHLGAHWQELLLVPEAWERLYSVDDAEVWKAHQLQKERLGRFTRSRLREQFARHGHSPDELRSVDGLFDPQVLTIGFARRFATYKRANLIFSDLERLRRLVADEDRPLQILFAGKAHPADKPGQELIQHIFELSRTDKLLGRVFFVENYDMRVGAMLVQGVDVWLNNPRRPLEASGTSGQKASLNGALNFSVLDGWWPEGYDGENGWSIGSEKTYDSEAEQDRADAESFYRTLEEEIAPLYYDRDHRGLSVGWVQRMKRAMATVSPVFSSDRMVRDYVEEAYLPRRR